GLEQLLYLDRLGAHIQPSMATKCLEKLLWTVWFPPDCSEFLQPQEQLLLGVIRGFSLANRALVKLQIISLARCHFELGDDWRGDAWYRGFVHRHGQWLKL